MPGILAWAVRGCLQWQERGLETPEIVSSATEAYRAEMDLIGQFLEERCTVAPDTSVRAKALWDEFYFWAADNGEQADRKTFGARLAARGFEKRKVGHDRAWTWFGLTLKTIAEAQRNQPLADLRPIACNRKSQA